MRLGGKKRVIVGRCDVYEGAKKEIYRTKLITFAY